MSFLTPNTNTTSGGADASSSSKPAPDKKPSKQEDFYWDLGRDGRVDELTIISEEMNEYNGMSQCSKALSFLLRHA